MMISPAVTKLSGRFFLYNSSLINLSSTLSYQHAFLKIDLYQGKAGLWQKVAQGDNNVSDFVVHLQTDGSYNRLLS